MSDLGYRLNNYQRLMLSFSQDAPYNAVHFCAIDSELTTEIIRSLLLPIIHDLGLGRPVFKDNRVEFEPINDISVLLKSCSLGQHAQTEISYQFDTHEFPLRFFLIKTTSSLYLSATYNHWVADAYSIQQLLKTLVGSLKGLKELHLTLNKTDDELSTYQRLTQRFTRTKRLLGNAVSFIKAQRSEMLSFETSDESVVSSELFEPNVIDALKAVAKKYDVTINDIFLSIIYLILTEKPKKSQRQKWYKPKRNRVILSVVSNIRTPRTLNEFSLWLGFFCVSLKRDEERDIASVLAKVNKQTQRAKKKRLAFMNTLLFPIQQAYYTRSDKPFKTFHKHTPIMAGISNMNLDSDKNKELLPDRYIRFSPAGPMCPLVFNFTNVNGRLSMTMTASSNRYNQQSLIELKKEFTDCLASLL